MDHLQPPFDNDLWALSDLSNESSNNMSTSSTHEDGLPRGSLWRWAAFALRYHGSRRPGFPHSRA